MRVLENSFNVILIDTTDRALDCFTVWNSSKLKSFALKDLIDIASGNIPATEKCRAFKQLAHCYSPTLDHSDGVTNFTDEVDYKVWRKASATTLCKKVHAMF